MSFCVKGTKCQSVTSPDPDTEPQELRVSADLLLSLSRWAVEYLPQCRVSPSWWDHRDVPRNTVSGEPRPLVNSAPTPYQHMHVESAAGPRQPHSPVSQCQYTHRQIHSHTHTHRQTYCFSSLEKGQLTPEHFQSVFIEPGDINHTYKSHFQTYHSSVFDNRCKSVYAPRFHANTPAAYWPMYSTSVLIRYWSVNM